MGATEKGVQVNNSGLDDPHTSLDIGRPADFFKPLDQRARIINAIPFAIPDPAYREVHLAAPLGDGTLGFTNPATIQAPVAGPHHEPRQVRDVPPPPPVEVPPLSEVIQPEVDAEQLAARGRGRRRGGAQTDSGEGQTSGPTTRRKGKGRAT
ncbi:hypothetical protein B0H10DRAFT_1964612 [Mycena sp. CBHHK59/15]|nr:hypothetical protein B0H10DRAFT_1964612 [Mycena sp. CBHHK59/15]